MSDNLSVEVEACDGDAPWRALQGGGECLAVFPRVPAPSSASPLSGAAQALRAELSTLLDLETLRGLLRFLADGAPPAWQEWIDCLARLSHGTKPVSRDGMVLPCLEIVLEAGIPLGAGLPPAAAVERVLERFLLLRAPLNTALRLKIQ